jgi:hypothetical protein
MTNSPAGDNTSNPRASISTDVPKSTCPAARKFAEYLARRMVPMIESAGRSNEPATQAKSYIFGMDCGGAPINRSEGMNE